MRINAEIWVKVEEHFEKIVTLPRDEKSSYLSYLHDTDPELHQILNDLLEEEEDLHPLLSQSAARIFETWQDQELIETHIGNYKLEKLLGQGAMASVFLCKRDDGEFDHKVALKLIRPGIYNDLTIKLFRKERQTLASLQHPHIARLYDGGVNAEGRPFFTMEFIDGSPVTDYCMTHELDFSARIELFRQIASAVIYAHKRFIAHLDLKPGNILVDQNGEIRILDFGIARMIPIHEIKDLPSQETEWNEHSKRFTLAYASPEQIRNEDLDSSSDIYSLGIILYELITGIHPNADLFTDPPRLKEKILQGSISPISRTNKSFPSGIQIKGNLSELEKIWLCATAKERENRYTTVESLLRDIDSYLEFKPVSVIEPTGIYLIKKFLQRNSRVVISVIAALITISLTISFYTHQVKKERDLAKNEAIKAARTKDLLTDIFKMADPNLANGDTITAIHLLLKGVENMEVSLKDEPEIKASMLHEISSIFLGLGRYRKADSLAREAYRLTAHLYQKPHPEHARSLLELGKVESIYKNLDTAQRHLQESYVIYKKISPPDLKSQANVLLEISNIFYEKGEYPASDSLMVEVYQIHRELYDPPNEELANDLQMIGSNKRKLGNLEEADRYYQESLEMKRKLFKEPHVEIAYTLNHLSSLKQDLGNYNEAIRYARESYDQRLQIYGPNHLETVASQSNLARIYKALGNYERSIQLYQEVLGKLKRIFPDGHPYIGATYQNLADLYSQSGQLMTAEEFYRKAIRIDDTFLDENDIHRSYAYLGFGKLLTRMNQLDEARELLEKANQLREDNLPEGHILIGISEQALGECLMAMKEYTTAIHFLDSAFESLNKLPEKYRENLHTILQELILATSHTGASQDQLKYQELLASLSY